MQKTKVLIEDANRPNQIIAQAPLNEGVILLEGNYYFDPEKVDMSNLIVTDRLYTCPYKGVCNWIDLRDPNGGIIKEVGWVYPQPKPEYQRIAGRIAFYPGMRRGTHTKLDMQQA